MNDSFAGLKCEVCRNEPAVGVFCVPGIPVSAAYGKTCLERGADPYGYLRANVACCGGVEHVRPEYLESLTYVNGEYLTLGEALKRQPLTEQELRFE
jgi:hypothetical protein